MDVNMLTWFTTLPVFLESCVDYDVPSGHNNLWKRLSDITGLGK